MWVCVVCSHSRMIQMTQCGHTQEKRERETTSGGEHARQERERERARERERERDWRDALVPCRPRRDCVFPCKPSANSSIFLIYLLTSYIHDHDKRESCSEAYPVCYTLVCGLFRRSVPWPASVCQGGDRHSMIQASAPSSQSIYRVPHSPPRVPHTSPRDSMRMYAERERERQREKQ